MKAGTAFRLKRGKIALSALACLTLFALMAYGLGKLILIGDGVPVNPWILWISVLVFGPIGFWCAGVALAHPVALRLNEDGGSGYYLAPFQWSEIRKVGLHVVRRYDEDATENTREHLFLALQFVDRAVWWERNSPMQRWLLALRGKQDGWDALIPLNALETSNQRAVIDLACDLHEGRNPTRL